MLGWKAVIDNAAEIDLNPRGPKLIRGGNIKGLQSLLLIERPRLEVSLIYSVQRSEYKVCALRLGERLLPSARFSIRQSGFTDSSPQLDVSLLPLV